MAILEVEVKRVIGLVMFLTFFDLPAAVTSLDCRGKPFHCENTTHFKVCVDFGNGVSNTMDDFVLPCPPGTECNSDNYFECEFIPPPTSPAPIDLPIDIATRIRSKDEGIPPTSIWEIVTPVLPTGRFKEKDISERYLVTEQYLPSLDNVSAITDTMDDSIISTTSASFLSTNSAILIEIKNESVHNQSLFENKHVIVPNDTDSVTVTTSTEENILSVSTRITATSYLENTETISEKPKVNVSGVIFSLPNELATNKTFSYTNTSDESNLFAASTTDTMELLTTTELQKNDFQSIEYYNNNKQTNEWRVKFDSSLSTETLVNKDIISNYNIQQSTPSWKELVLTSADNIHSTISINQEQKVTDVINTTVNTEKVNEGETVMDELVVTSADNIYSTISTNQEQKMTDVINTTVNTGKANEGQTVVDELVVTSADNIYSTISTNQEQKVTDVINTTVNTGKANEGQTVVDELVVTSADNIYSTISTNQEQKVTDVINTTVNTGKANEGQTVVDELVVTSADNIYSTISTNQEQKVTDVINTTINTENVNDGPTVMDSIATDVPEIKNIFLIIVPNNFENIGINYNNNSNSIKDSEDKGDPNVFLLTNSPQYINDADKITTENYFDIMENIPLDTSINYVEWTPSSFESLSAVPEETNLTKTTTTEQFVRTTGAESNEFSVTNQNITDLVHPDSNEYKKPDNSFNKLVEFAANESVSSNMILNIKNASRTADEFVVPNNIYVTTDSPTTTFSEKASNVSSQNENYLFIIGILTNPTTEMIPTTGSVSIPTSEITKYDNDTNSLLKLPTQVQIETTTELPSIQNPDIFEDKENINTNKPEKPTINVIDIIMNKTTNKEPEYTYNDIDSSLTNVNKSTVIDSAIVRVQNLAENTNGENKKIWNEFNIGLNEHFLINRFLRKPSNSGNQQDVVNVDVKIPVKETFNIKKVTAMFTPVTEITSTYILDPPKLSSPYENEKVEIVTSITESAITLNIPSEIITTNLESSDELTKVSQEPPVNVINHDQIKVFKKVEASTLDDREVYKVVTKIISPIPVLSNPNVVENINSSTVNVLESKDFVQLNGSNNKERKLILPEMNKYFTVQHYNGTTGRHIDIKKPENMTNSTIGPKINNNLTGENYNFPTTSPIEIRQVENMTDSNKTIYTNVNYLDFDVNNSTPNFTNEIFLNRSIPDFSIYSKPAEQINITDFLNNMSSVKELNLITVNFTDTHKKTMENMEKLLSLINETQENISKAYDRFLHDMAQFSNSEINKNGNNVITQKIINQTENPNEKSSQDGLFKSIIKQITLLNKMARNSTESKPSTYTSAATSIAGETTVTEPLINVTFSIVEDDKNITKNNDSTVKQHATVSLLSTNIKNDTHIISETSNANKTNIKRNIASINVKNKIAWERTEKSENSINCTHLPSGRYPDNRDCRKFYICVDKSAIVGYCPINTVFSTMKLQCTKNLHHCIRDNEFQCTVPGRFRDLMRQNVYYICVQKEDAFVRYKYQCQIGFHLDELNVKCVPSVVSVHTHESMKSINSPNKVKHSLSTEPRKYKESENSEMEEAMERRKESLEDRLLKESLKRKELINRNRKAHEHRVNVGNKNNGKCTEEGKIAHPMDCRKYYICYKNKKSELRRRRKKCDSDEVFDSDKKKCVDADSYECHL